MKLDGTTRNTESEKKALKRIFLPKRIQRTFKNVLENEGQFYYYDHLYRTVLATVNIPINYYSVDVEHVGNLLNGTDLKKIHEGIHWNNFFIHNVTQGDDFGCIVYYYMIKYMIAYEVLSHDKCSVRSHSIPELIDSSRAGMMRKDDPHHITLDREKKVRFLFLNHLEIQRGTEFTSQTLFSLLNARVAEQNKTTIIMSAIDINQVSNRFGVPVAGLISDHYDLIEVCQ